MDRLKDQVVIVTGGANGIGKAFCEGLAQEGARVVIADIDVQGADSLAAALGEAGHEALAVATDVSQEADAANLANAAIQRFGRIDGLVNNAAIMQRVAMFRGPFEEMSRGGVGPAYGRQPAGRVPVYPGGGAHHEASNEVVKSSTLARERWPGGTASSVHYVTSKAGVIGFTRTLARSLGDYNINVNAIAPGATISMDEVDEGAAELRQAMIQTRAIKRAEFPEDLVGPVIFLCSHDSDFVTGQTVAVNGGAWMH